MIVIIMIMTIIMVVMVMVVFVVVMAMMVVTMMIMLMVDLCRFSAEMFGSMHSLPRFVMIGLKNAFGFCTW